MAAIILAWNPELWDGWQPAYPEAVDLVAATGAFQAHWSVGRHRNIEAGSEAWLLLQGGQGRGLIGHATVTSEPYPGPHFRRPSATANYVEVVFDVLLPRGDEIPAAELLARVPGIPWKAVRGSGLAVPAGSEPALRTLWADHVLPSAQDPTLPVPGTLPGEAVTRVLANRYERDVRARRDCLEHHGLSCAACGFNFEAVYGEIGHEFIHVHHLVPVALLGPGYELDPLTDLVPLCANCHAMVHTRPDPIRPAELRRIIDASRAVAAEVATPEEEAALDEARRMLG
ncbi:HNH endonuclease [Arthrobacter sp. I2-34]|uniref:HNH endonuclease n=1 Tax=Arthrobacter hankyongi TaxID=2904801 RepID=A0ABS9L8B1_9MICC|nr:HNH endonuclease [Arthrobacter hankyongi]MCG2622921.1 HNH endonuclease [Arthrobacter hankyongi]